MPDYHIPVMLTEVLDILKPENGKNIIDCTLGGGGHALEIVKQVLPDGKLIGIDRDEDAIRESAEKLSGFSKNVILKKGNFADLEDLIDGLGIERVDGLLIDLGVSSHQLDTAERGFSFRTDSALDMRMDREQALKASDLVNSLSERNLADLIWKYGEERWSKRIAKLIVERRSRKRIESTKDLVDAVLAAVPAGARKGKIHPATRTFQAIRIAVNLELDSLEAGLESAIRLLAKGGRICVLSYHSLEDRIVKGVFSRNTGKCICPSSLPVCACGAVKRLEILTKRPLMPSEEETRSNPRARSVRTRAAEKL